MASESSIISTTSQDQGDSSHSKKGVNMKEKDQIQYSNSKSSKSKKPIDFLKLLKDDSVPVSKVQEHNIFDTIQIGSSSCFPNNNNPEKDENNNEKKNSDSRSFSCSFCDKQYSTSQALGGHQTAHRKEYGLGKERKKRYDGGALGLGKPYFNPYRSYPSTLFTPFNYRSLGVNTESTIHKPHYFNTRVTPHSFEYNRGSLLQQILNPSLVSLSNIGSGNSGVENLGIGNATTLRIEDGTTNKIGDILKLGDSSTNVATKSIHDQSKSNC